MVELSHIGVSPKNSENLAELVSFAQSQLMLLKSHKSELSCGHVGCESWYFSTHVRQNIKEMFLGYWHIALNHVHQAFLLPIKKHII